MDITKLSSQYRVCKLSEQDIDSVLELCLGNPQYYHHCPPNPTRQSIARDMTALPPRTTYDDKYYLGFRDGTKLVAVLDLILNYPNASTAFIGFFMVAAQHQKKGIGTSVVKEILECLWASGYEYTRLGYVKGNSQSEAFWHKNGFAETGIETDTEDYTIVVTQRSNRCYYKAYDERYKAIHEKNHTWAADNPTPIVLELLKKNDIPKDAPVLEIGCGEGRDSIAVLKDGYDLLASDVSAEAVRFCKERYPSYRSHFKVVDACRDVLAERYAFIFAASVLHMLVDDADRKAFLGFFHRHLNKNGKALILTMGDGVGEFSTDANTAYQMQERTNNASGISVIVPNTSCRMVNFATLERELRAAELVVLESGITQSLPDFDSLMYVVVARAD